MRKTGLIGDRAFYKRVLKVSIPIMIQMGITNFVSLLDNIMVGALGTESMSGVSIVNQFVFIFTLLIFGAVSAAGIFTAQYFGGGDIDGVRYTFRFKMLVNLGAGILGVAVFSLFGDVLINLFLHEGESTGDLALAFSEAKRYLTYTVIGLIPYSLSQVYASTLRETGEQIVPMVASVAAVITNLIFNLLLIFGYLGFPALGVAGAAIATVIARFLEFFILVVWTHAHKERAPFIVGAFRSLYIPAALVKSVVLKGLPIMVNELLWSFAITMRNQCYSTRGMDALAATSISSTVFNLFAVVHMSMGSSIAILVGNKLGAGEIEEAKEDDKKMIAFSVAIAVVMGAVLFAVSPLLPRMYDVEPSVREIATYMLIVSAVMMPVYAFAHASYFTIRSGGKVLITFLLDCGFMWVVIVPLALALAHLTSMNIYLLYAICQCAEILKVVLGAILLKKSNWACRLVD